MAQPTASPGSRETQGRSAVRADRHWMTLVAVAVAQLMVVLDATIVNIRASGKRACQRCPRQRCPRRLVRRPGRGASLRTLLKGIADLAEVAGCTLDATDRAHVLVGVPRYGVASRRGADLGP
jgi:hypothetical protein